MRTETITIYTYEELPTDKAKTKARDWYREGWDYPWGDDAIASLKAFAKHFGATLRDWSIDWSNSCYSSAKFHYTPDDIEDANALEAFIAAKVGELKHDGSCQFTSYCADDDCNEGAVKAYAAGERDLNAILQAGFQSWLAAAQADYAASMEDDAVAESIIANGYEFLADGSRA